jgi:hypothetical protein
MVFNDCVILATVFAKLVACQAGYGKCFVSLSKLDVEGRPS